MQLCLGVKTLQSAVSVICQISYLVSNSNLNDPTTSPQAKALFGLNIGVSLTSFVIMGLDDATIERQSFEVCKGKDTESSNKEIKMSNDIVYTDNPLQNSSDSKDATSHNHADGVYMSWKWEVSDQKTENANKNQEITGQKSEITDLRQKLLT